jgi:dTDP-4-amino-4,6-dideoxygalactose transaminase
LKKPFIPFARPSIGEEEIAEVIDSLRSGWLTTGPKTKRFEEEFAAFVGAPFALAVNSGTAAMHLALEAIGLAEGEWVVTTPFTFTATAEVIRHCDAHPLFVDIEPNSGNLDPEFLTQALDRAESEGKRVRAIMPVHFAGRPCDMGRIMELAGKRSIKVVEDAAHAFSSSYGRSMIGNLGDLTCFSFYATKPITTGEGGMVTTADEGFEKRIRMMRLHGITRDTLDRYSSNKRNWSYEVEAPGFKYNLTDVAAAIGIHQLRKAEKFRLRRKEIASKYETAFSDMPVFLPSDKDLPPGSRHAWHLYVIRLDTDCLSINRDQFIERMFGLGVETSVHFIPLHLQPYWKNRYGFSAEDFPASLSFYQSCVSLPIYPGMTDENVDTVINSAREILSIHAT